MGGEEAAPVFPEEGPELLSVGPGHEGQRELVRREEGEGSLGMRRGDGFEPGHDFKEEHEPMGLALVAALADEPCQMEVGGPQPEARFFGGLAAGAGVGGFADGGFEFAARRAPEPEVGFARSAQEQDFPTAVEAVEQGGNFVGHGRRFLFAHWGRIGDGRRFGQPARDRGQGRRI